MAEPQYKKVDPTVFKRNMEASRNRKFGGDFWKPQAGKTGQPIKNVIRILPPHTNMGDVFVETKVHFSLGPQEDTFIRCIDDDTCPACIYVNKLFREARQQEKPEDAKALKEKAKSKMAKFNFYANIVDMQHPESGVQTWAFGPDIEKNLRECFNDDEQEFRDISDPRTGRDVIFLVDKKPQTDYNQYTGWRAKENQSELKDPSWLNDIRDLTEYEKKPTVEEVEAALSGKKPEQQAKPQKQSETNAAAKAPATPPKGRTITPPKADTPKPEPQSEVTGKRVVRKTEDPYAAAKKIAADAGFTPVLITPDDVKGVEGPDCYSVRFIAAGDEFYKDPQIADPTDSNCQKCRLFLSCLSAKLAVM